MIRVQCPQCGAKLTVPEIHAGKAGRCPRCKGTIALPPAPEPGLQLVREDTPEETRAPSKLLDDVAARPARMPARKEEDSPENRLAQRMLDALTPAPADEHTGERRIPWFIDILLYPFSVSGVITLVVLILLPALLDVLPMGLFVGGRLFYYWGPVAVMGLYTIWYLAECVYDSAKGGTRAPEIIDANTGLDDLWSRGSYLLAVYLLFVGPVLFYRMYPGRMDAVFWGLVAWAVIFFPMGLLAMVIHDSVSVLNPLFLLGSILRVLPAYAGLLGGIGVLALLFLQTGNVFGQGLAPQWLGLLHTVLGAYATLVLAHVLGRFYWRYRDRLDWGI
ncbi:MAG: zinc-ribbon domain-containing protein [Planctomycetes bacterium]|nr:zinc-ribbon domain-containing protein [Planctomycetota bacterium]